MQSVINVLFCEQELRLDDFAHEIWHRAESVRLDKYWSGEPAPPGRAATAQLLWTSACLFVRFDCAQNEPLVASRNPRLDREAENLWERDVCEIYIAPDKHQPEKYFEFEVAPTGEWLDYAIHQLADRRETDTTFDSGVETHARVEKNSFTVIFKIEWSAFGNKPTHNEEWAGNLFRCVGQGETRGYLTWLPTFTAKPNFHVPAAFGTFKFIG